MFIQLTHGGFEFPVVVNSEEIISIWPGDQLGKGSEIKFRKKPQTDSRSGRSGRDSRPAGGGGHA